MNMQSAFISNIEATYGEAGTLWLAQLPSHLTRLSKQWDFHLIQPMADLSYSFVALAALNTSQEIVILKTAPQDGSLISEVKWLQYFKKGVPRVYQFDEEKNAFLMERLEPGTTLKTWVNKGEDEAATRIICQLILALQSEQHTPPAFKPLSTLAISLPLLKGKMDDLIVSKAESLFQALSSDCKHDVLLHGDLHHDNILASDSSWKTIDPHGYIGDPAAEVGAMIRNPFDCFPTNLPLKKVIERRLTILCEMLPFDSKRIEAWAFCITMLSAAWDIEGFGKISGNKAEIAHIIHQIIS